MFKFNNFHLLNPVNPYSNEINTNNVPNVDLGIKNSIIFDPTNAHVFNDAPCEKVYQGGDNTWIVFGRDRPGGWESGYGGMGHYKAGAIDIVVGRMSALDAELNSGPVNSSPGADAARLYLSQKSDPDENYFIPDGKTGKSFAMSAAVLKADAVRIVGRDSLKLVTKTDAKLSTGVEAYRNYGVQLIADDGGLGGIGGTPLQPIPKGHNLVKAFRELVKHILDLNGILKEHVRIQGEFNKEISDHTHFSPFWAKETSFDPFVVIKHKETLLQEFLKTEQGLKANSNNFISWKGKFLNSINKNYINSAYHYLN